MDTTYLGHINWDEFRSKHPAAYSTLLRESLQQEKRLLEVELGHQIDDRRKRWIEARLCELSHLS